MMNQKGYVLLIALMTVSLLSILMMFSISMLRDDMSFLESLIEYRISQ